MSDYRDPFDGVRDDATRQKVRVDALLVVGAALLSGADLEERVRMAFRATRRFVTEASSEDRFQAGVEAVYATATMYEQDTIRADLAACVELEAPIPVLEHLPAQGLVLLWREER